MPYHHNEFLESRGPSGAGDYYAQNCAAATAVQVKATAGVLVQVLVVALGTAAVTIWDNAAAAASGNVLMIIPASAALGTIYRCNMPAANGIWVGGTTNTPQLTVSYI